MTGRDPSKDKPKPRRPQKPTKGAVPGPDPDVVQAGPDDKWPDDPSVTGGVDSPANYSLPNPKQERFAQLIAAGKPLHEAYLDAGYRGSPGNARRLRADEAVWERIKTLQAEIGKRVVEDAAAEIKALSYSRDDAFREAGDALKLAMGLGLGAAAVAAVKLRTEIAGMKIGEGAVPLNPEADGHVAKSLEDPRVVQDILNVQKARKLLVIPGGKQKL